MTNKEIAEEIMLTDKLLKIIVSNHIKELKQRRLFSRIFSYTVLAVLFLINLFGAVLIFLVAVKSEASSGDAVALLAAFSIMLTSFVFLPKILTRLLENSEKFLY